MAMAVTIQWKAVAGFPDPWQQTVLETEADSQCPLREPPTPAAYPRNLSFSWISHPFPAPSFIWRSERYSISIHPVPLHYCPWNGGQKHAFSSCTSKEAQITWRSPGWWVVGTVLPLQESQVRLSIRASVEGGLGPWQYYQTDSVFVK